MLPLVSVVMPCFNAGRMLRPALASVLQQTWPAIEVIFVDNNSTDDSAAVAREMLAASDRPFTLTACPVQGANNARNHGYTLVTGDYIQWMDADDALDRDKIERQVAVLQANPRDDIAYGDWSAHRIAPGRPDMVERFALRQIDDQVQRTLAGVWYPPHLYLLRRAAADRLQAESAWWPPRTVATDVEYSALAALLGSRFRHVPGAHVRYNVWSEMQTSNATPYRRRVASLRAIFQRLRQFVEAGRASVTVAARHKTLLHQDWNLLYLSDQSATLTPLPGRRFALQRRDGRQIELRPREASIVRAMMSAKAVTPFHHVLTLAASVPRLTDDHVAIAQTIQRLQREGFLEQIEPPGDAAASSF